ncbi:hypothetical protein DGMP_09330 [Desulfomarina profundi]|uniref:Uncharacterized protein n=1 Tax=Desulfomarina profundi TaxID=2772557 RepID=A0A8D5FM78_9BACT|nr:hypothetical protein [Desulfomarina profundi]BCL60240.1 hypothetical protein DGMP_09330 [Desulfomarina profundi]
MKENEIINLFVMTVISALFFSDSYRVRKIPGSRPAEAEEHTGLSISVLSELRQVRFL